MQLKICTKCKKEKSISEFKKDNSRKDRHHPHCRGCCRIYHIKNNQDILKKIKVWQQANSKQIKNNKKKKYWSDIQSKNSNKLRNRLYMFIHGRTNSLSTQALIGCSRSFLLRHLENQFKHGMNWDNYGRKNGIRCWELDHIRPCASFDLSKPEEQRKCFHYTNLQPLWAKENKVKWIYH